MGKFKQKGFPSRKDNPQFSAANFYRVAGSEEALGNIPKFKPLGSSFGPRILNFGAAKTTLPTLQVLHFCNTFGDTNALNVALSKMMATMRAKNSRIGAYEPGDLGQVLVAGTDIYVQIAMLGTAIYAAQTYVESKYALGNMIIAALHFNVADFRANLAAYKALYVTLRERILNAVYIPQGFLYFERKIALISAIFSDDKTDTSQIFMFVPDHYLYYNEQDAVVEARFLDNTGTGRLYSRVVDQFNEQLDTMIYSEALTTMWGDIKSGYTAFYDIKPLVMEGQLEIAVISDALDQVLNAEILPIVMADSATALDTSYDTGINAANEIVHCACVHPFVPSLSLRQDAAGLLFQGYSILDPVVYWGNDIQYSNVTDTVRHGSGWASAATVMLAEGHLINSYHDTFDANDLMLATRFMFEAKTDTAGQRVVLQDCGTEILVARDIYYVSTSVSDIRHIFFAGILCSTTTNINHENSDYSAIIADAAFDWSPQIWLTLPTDGTAGVKEPTISTIRRLFYPGKVLPLSTKNLIELHRVAVQSLMQVYQ